MIPEEITPKHRFLFAVVWCGWFGVVWFGVVWFGLVWCGLVRCGLVWFGDWTDPQRMKME